MAADRFGPIPGGWVRQGNNSIRICEEYGADASRMDHELTVLAKAAKQIRQANNATASLCAATFFHLRFQRIHPLVEGNGRIGRLLLAMQLQQALQVSPVGILTGLKDWERDYNRVFVSRDSTVILIRFQDEPNKADLAAWQDRDARNRSWWSRRAWRRRTPRRPRH